MDLDLDVHAHLDSSIHRWEPRCKLVGLMALIFAFSFVSDLRLLLPMVAVTVVLYRASRLPLSFLRTRLRYPGFFLMALVVLLPFISGSTELVRLGPLMLRREGCLDVVLIGTKFVSILTVGLVLFGSAPFLEAIKAMRALGLPSVLADMTLFSYRYIHEIGEDLERMEIAMGLRGFRSRRVNRGVLSALASLAGSLLVRSYERSERVYKAMVLRGYGRGSHARADSEVGRWDRVALGVALFLAVVFVAGEILLRK